MMNPILFGITVSHDSCTTLSVPHSQDTFAKSMMPMYNFILVCRGQAVQMVQAIERAMPAARLSPYSFKQLEQIRDPEDFHSIVCEMMDENHKPTAVRFGSVTGRIICNRWWVWILQHPQINTEEIQPTKSMHLNHSCVFV